MDRDVEYNRKYKFRMKLQFTILKVRNLKTGKYMCNIGSVKRTAVTVYAIEAKLSRR